LTYPLYIIFTLNNRYIHQNDPNQIEFDKASSDFIKIYDQVYRENPELKKDDNRIQQSKYYYELAITISLLITGAIALYYGLKIKNNKLTWKLIIVYIAGVIIISTICSVIWIAFYENIK